MTKPIPAWSANLSVNVPKDERQLIGRLAMQRGAKSVSEFIKKLLLRGMEQECAASAAQLREIRRRYYGTMMVIVFCGTLFGHQEIRAREIRVRGRDNEFQLDFKSC